MPKLIIPFVSDRLTSSSSFLSLYPLPVRIFRRYPPRTRHMSVRMEQCTRHRKDKVVVIMGATGAGKSRLSVDLATLFAAEIINSDKMQLYDGLHITTNQIPIPERCGVPHHLLGVFDPDDGELTAGDFHSAAATAISGIISRGKLPILAGGSNSFIHALLAERFDPGIDPFSGSGSICSELRYDCCFLWVDVSLPILFEYLAKRVDEMMEMGMFEELAEFYDPENDPGTTQVGIRKAIGVPEFDRYFRMYPPEKPSNNTRNRHLWDPARKAAYEKAVREIKENTCRLAKKQIGKILKLRNSGWEMTKLDATASFEAALRPPRPSPEEEGRGRWREIWEKEILEPSVKIVKRFLEE